MENNKYMRVRLRKNMAVEGISLFHYITNGVNSEKETLRNLVFTFKEDSLRSQLFKEYLAEKIAQYLPSMFGCEKNDLAILCIPTSKKKKLDLRYKSFCDKLNSVGIRADHETLYLSEDVKTKHKKFFCPEEDKFLKEFSECIKIKKENLEKLRGKKIVIFDDVITNGSNIKMCYELLKKEMGADITFLTLGRTYNKNYEGDFSSTTYEYAGNIEVLMNELKNYTNISKLIA